jgi:hypothetical protein
LHVWHVQLPPLKHLRTPRLFTKNNLSFDYPNGWTLTDDTNDDAQQLSRARERRHQIRVFVHKGRVTPEKLADAKKAFIDPYIAATTKQFVAMGQSPSSRPTAPKSVE